MTDSPDMRGKWDARYREAQGPVSAAEVLQQNLQLLPAHGRALDLACGLGGNALLLAEQGLDTFAWDISPVAIERLAITAEQQDLDNLHAEVRDVERQPPAAESFDVIVVSNFLERDLASALVAALRPGGLLFYQTWSNNRATDRGPQNPAYRLLDNELLTLFAALRVRVYREEGMLGDTTQGFRDQAMLVAERPD